MTPALALSFDTKEAERFLSRLLAELEGRTDLVHAFLQPLDCIPELFSVDLEQRSTGGAVHLRAVLEPTEFLRELVLAVGAGDVDRLLIENRAHGGSHAS